jgi:hypothetical protein
VPVSKGLEGHKKSSVIIKKGTVLRMKSFGGCFTAVLGAGTSLFECTRYEFGWSTSVLVNMSSVFDRKSSFWN